MKAEQKFCAVVKADAYGLGAKKICREINDIVDYFAVSSEKEFLEINQLVTKPILLIDPIYENITNLAKQNCEFCVSNLSQFNLILGLAEKNKDINFKIHISFNTGMNRFGFTKIKDVLKIFSKVEKTQNLSIFGVFSHFYQGNQENFVKIQSDKFSSLCFYLNKKFDLSCVSFHISNSSGFFHERKFDMFRIGKGMFCFNNKDVFSLETKIIEIQTIKKGETAGYGLAFFANKKTRVAVCAIGYADGFPRRMAGVGKVLINGKFCKVLAVCMDSIIVDNTYAGAKLLDTVTIIGKNGNKQISCCKMASWCDTIDYEIMTGISGRVKREYTGENLCKSSQENTGQESLSQLTQMAQDQHLQG